MNKLEMQTPNITNENIEKIAKIFPNCVKESKIDFDLLKQELSNDIIEGSKERYNLDWVGKKKAVLATNAPIRKTLRPCKDESVNFDTTENLFIEGDNLDTLKLLQKTYLNKIKMIYIDPPYNTGKDFIYKDNFAKPTEEYFLESEQKDEEGNKLTTNLKTNGRYHSDWLSMMYPRLKLARNLLSDDGVIFISIDDNEVHNLRKICDEIFGEENFIAEFIWNGKSGSEDDGDIRNNHEYLICYNKNSSIFNVGLDSKEDEKFPYYDELKKDYYKRQMLRKWGDNSKRADRPNLYYSIKTPEGNDFFPKLPNGDDGCWRWGKDKMLESIANNNIEFCKNKSDKIEAYEKIYKSDNSRKTKKFQSLLDDVGSTSSGTKSLKILFDDKKLFDRPKPTEYIEKMCNIANITNDSIILDFFAGSSTTAHAVMQLNAEDGGNRKFIMVQYPEKCDEKTEAFKAGYKTIAEISKERIRRAGKKIKEENETNIDTGFRVLKVDTTNMRDVYYEANEMTQELLSDTTNNIKDDRTSEDLLYQVLLDLGIGLSLPIKTETIDGNEIFIVNNNELIACFDRAGKITDDFCKKLAERKPERVVFCDGGFENDQTKINVGEIFKFESPDTSIKTI